MHKIVIYATYINESINEKLFCWVFGYLFSSTNGFVIRKISNRSCEMAIHFGKKKVCDLVGSGFDLIEANESVGLRQRRTVAWADECDRMSNARVQRHDTVVESVQNHDERIMTKVPSIQTETKHC